MSEVRTFFRFCPSCGKRFHIKLVARKLVDEKRESTVIRRTMPAPVPGTGVYGGGSMGIPVILEEDEPVTIDEKDFQYTYKCKHCGHVWTEMHEEEKRL